MAVRRSRPHTFPITELRLISLHPRYNDTKSDDFALKARMIAALAFVPPSELDNAVTELSPILPAELVPVLNNFEDTYLGRFYGI